MPKPVILWHLGQGNVPLLSAHSHLPCDTWRQTYICTSPQQITRISRRVGWGQYLFHKLRIYQEKQAGYTASARLTVCRLCSFNLYIALRLNDEHCLDAYDINGVTAAFRVIVICMYKIHIHLVHWTNTVHEMSYLRLKINGNVANCVFLLF